MSHSEKPRGKTITNPGGRIICIGDLQGMYDEALELLEKCQVTPRDKVIFLGDLVDRGPQNGKCVDLAMKHECILGNHENRHIQYDDVERKKGYVDVVIPTHVETRKQLRREHYDYFRSLPHFIRLPEHNAACVHAGVFPRCRLEEQSAHILLHAQMLRPYITDENGTKRANVATRWPSKVPGGEENDWKFWTHFWDGPERIIFGHSVFDRPLVTPYAVGIDGGACFGMQLHALVLPSWEIVSVSAREPLDQSSRGRTNTNRNRKKVSKHEVHDGVYTFS